MSSLRRVQSSKANGALSKGPSTPAGKQRSSLNAIRHGLCANCIVLDHESRENFLILLQQHVDRFQPANEVESGMIEEMCAAYWRQRRAWAIETALLDKQIALHTEGSNADRLAAAFDTLAAAPGLPFIMLRTVKLPNEPSPISEHLPPSSNPLIPNHLLAHALACISRHPRKSPEAPSEQPISPSCGTGRPVGQASWPVRSTPNAHRPQSSFVHLASPLQYADAGW